MNEPQDLNQTTDIPSVPADSLDGGLPAGFDKTLEGSSSGQAKLRSGLDPMHPGLVREADGESGHAVQAGSAAVAAPSGTGDRYELSGEIARGGMGIIYRALDTSLGREVAVKVLQQRFGAGSSAARRFANEARIAGQLQHPSIPPVHDVGVLPDGRPFLAMKLIRGQTLEELLNDRADPAAERGRFVAVFEQVCQAAACAHAHNVIHRDLKPANVMVGSFGEVQVMDWGLAKVLGSLVDEGGDPEATTSATQVDSVRDTGQSGTVAGSVLGTPAFMPPEQAIGAVGEIDARSDVFGLGAILAVILTGKPPFIAETVETTRVKAARAEVSDCFAHLDACGADPDLIALCKQCLAPKPVDRPADAGVVANAVAELRAAADERARRAELERVRVEGEKATAEARSNERRKRRRLWIGAAAVLAMALVGGLAAVLVVQRRANDDLAVKNGELADEQAKVQARFELAQKAIETFHTGVSEDVLLSNEQFKELRTKLLKEAAGFYADMEKLLAGQTDPRSRKALAAGYFQLGELTAKIGSKPEALAVLRKSLAVRCELAGATGADVETRLDVARGLGGVGGLLQATGNSPGALEVYQEQRALAEQLAAEDSTDSVRAVLAQSYNNLGLALSDTGKPAEALESFERARGIRQKLADANPDVTTFQKDLARSHRNIGALLAQTGKPAAALESYERARAIQQKLADADPAATKFQSDLAQTHYNIGVVLSGTGKPAQALAAYERALAIRQKLAETNPAVTDFQSELAQSHTDIGNFQLQAGKPVAALAAYEEALVIRQKLADANPTVTHYQLAVAQSCFYIGDLCSQTRKPAEALAAYEQALAICQKLADANPSVPQFQRALVSCHNNIGSLHARQKRYADAFTALGRALAIGGKLTHDYPKITDYASGLAYSHAYRGWARIYAGQPAEAAADLRQALEQWAKHPTPSIDTRFERCRSLALLAGLGGDATSGVTADEAATFADQAVAALRDTVNAGWAQPDELKEPDFDLLRSREDFKKLLAELEAKRESRDRRKG